MNNLELIMNMFISANINFELETKDKEGYFLFVKLNNPEGLITFDFHREGKFLTGIDFILEEDEEGEK